MPSVFGTLREGEKGERGAFFPCDKRKDTWRRVRLSCVACAFLFVGV